MARAGGLIRVAGVAVFGLLVTMVANPAQAQQGAAGRTAGETGKNVQVLKDLPADQLIPTMRFFTYSLGVNCQFCHVQGDNPSDDKPTKKTAREMISMVMAINKDNFNARTAVTCYTCHRGANEPEPIQPGESTKIVPGGTPPPPAGRGGAGRGEAPAAAEAKPELPTADAILAKYVQALGGEQALRAISSRTLSGERDTAGRNDDEAPWAKGSFELYQKAPNLETMVMSAGNGQMTATGFDGTSAWTQNANGAVVEAEGTALARAKRMADFYEPLDLKQEYTRTRVRAGKLDGRDVYVLIGTPENDTPEQLYFDKDSGLLVRRITFMRNVVINAPTQIDYQDYREADGVKYPSTIKIAVVNDNPVYTVLRVTKADFKTPVDASRFEKPASKPRQGRGGRGA
jgi:photosynthetic reaction center cytochrome c subunit